MAIGEGAVVYMGRSGGGGNDVVVAVEMETAGELDEARTTFFSCVAVSSQRSTCSTKNVESTSLHKSRG